MNAAAGAFVSGVGQYRQVHQSQATAYRYLDEAIEVLAARAPGLREALEKAKEQGDPEAITEPGDIGPVPEPGQGDFALCRVSASRSPSQPG